MTPEELVAALRAEVITSNQSEYKKWFLTDPTNARSPYWHCALALFAKLQEDERKVFFEVLRQVQVDTVSNMLGIIDGSSYLADSAPQLELRAVGGEKFSYLQDYFLALEEDDPAS
jgi:hypothetical protein